MNKAFQLIYAKIKFQGARTDGRVFACRKLKLRNPQHFIIGRRCFFGPDCRIEAWDEYNGTKYNPTIEFGEDVRINSTCHIGAINKVVIGNQCLLGSHVMIIDHSHGRGTAEETDIHPSERNLYSKGPVIIGDRCWLAENVVVLPGVTIGDGCIIGANAVVTKDIPPYSVAAGNPARVVRIIKEEATVDHE